MKKLLMIAIICASTVVYAEGEKPNFETQKTKALEMIAKRQVNLDTFKSCVSSTTDKDSMKKCREANKSTNMAMREGRKAKRAAEK